MRKRSGLEEKQSRATYDRLEAVVRGKVQGFIQDILDEDRMNHCLSSDGAPLSAASIQRLNRMGHCLPGAMAGGRQCPIL